MLVVCKVTIQRFYGAQDSTSSFKLPINKGHQSTGVNVWIQALMSELRDGNEKKTFRRGGGMAEKQGQGFFGVSPATSYQ